MWIKTIIALIILLLVTLFGRGCMVNWNLLDEPWDELGDWTKGGFGISEINPAGQLHQKSTMQFIPYVFRWKILSGGLPPAYTIETRLKIITWLGGYYEYNLDDGIKEIDIIIYYNHIRVLNELGQWDFHLVDTDEEFHVWKFEVDSVANTLKLYKDSIFLHEFTSLYNGGTDGYVATKVIYPSEAYEDYFKIASAPSERFIPHGLKSDHANKTAESDHSRKRAASTYAKNIAEAYASIAS